MYWPNSPNQPSPTISASELDTRRLHLNRLTINKLSISMYAKTLLLVDEWIKDECFVIVFVSAYQQSTKVQYAGCLIMMATWVFILVCLFNWTMHQHQTEANSYQNCTFVNNYLLHLTYFLIFAHMMNSLSLPRQSSGTSSHITQSPQEYLQKVKVTHICRILTCK